MANPSPPSQAITPVSDVVALLHALGQSISWNALMRLVAAGPQSVNDLAAAGNCAQVSISRHMAQLCDAGAVEMVPDPDGDGRKICYAIPSGRLRETANGKEIDYGSCVLRLA